MTARSRWRHERWTGWRAEGSTTRSRRVLPIQHRRGLACAPLREDALRQRAAPAGVHTRLAAHAQPGFPTRPPTARRGSCSPRCDRPPADSYPPSMPTPKGSRVATTPGRGMSSWRPWAGRSRGPSGHRLPAIGKGRTFCGCRRTPRHCRRSGSSVVDLEAARRLLREARDQRTHPTVDDKVDRCLERSDHPSLSVAGRALDRPDLVEAAAACARFIDEHLRDGGAKACSDPSVPAEPRCPASAMTMRCSGSACSPCSRRRATPGGSRRLVA